MHAPQRLQIHSSQVDMIGFMAFIGIEEEPPPYDHEYRWHRELRPLLSVQIITKEGKEAKIFR